ncbi:MAG: hypothetical protein HUJ91_04305 [Bacteroidales bacterium]|nr:hypothetical protein [Bacteroidales bacterium]
MDLYLGIDLGTTNFKVGIYDSRGHLLGLGRTLVGKETEGNRCILQVNTFWKNLKDAIAEALAESGASPQDIRGVSYSSQANSFLLLGDELQPLTPFVMWPDTRPEGDCPPLDALLEHPDYLSRTGLGVALCCEAMPAKIHWFRKNEPKVLEKARAIMTISDYLVHSLTGNRLGDVGTASLTGLLDCRKAAWWQDSLDIFGIDKGMLSTPLRCGSEAGTVTAEGASLSGLAQGTKVFIGNLDHYMVALGAGVPTGNRISESTGTVLACVNYSKTYCPRIGVDIAPGFAEGEYFQISFNNNGATALEWYREHHIPERPIEQMSDMAATVPMGCEGLAALPCCNKYPALEGFTGIKESHSHAHFARAIMESTAVSLAELVKSLDPDGECREIIPSGGGARSRVWLQIKADTLRLPFLLQESGELATKGAAMVCAIGTGMFASTDEAIDQLVTIKDIIR